MRTKDKERAASDADSRQAMQERLNQADALQGIRHGLEQTAQGEGRSAEEVFAAFRAKHGIANG